MDLLIPLALLLAVVAYFAIAHLLDERRVVKARAARRRAALLRRSGGDRR